MPALNFVAVEDGLEEDPKVRGLAILLKVTLPLAFWCVVRWRRLILRCGNHLTGTLPKNYSDADIAAFLEWAGRPRQLVEAMKRQGFVVFKKGRGFSDPSWKNSITGRYAAKREDNRVRMEQLRREGREEDVRERASAVRAQFAHNPTERKKERTDGGGAERPPDAPPPSATPVEERWAWLEENAPRPRNRESSKRELAQLSEAEWLIVKGAYEQLAADAPDLSLEKKRALRKPTDLFLRKSGWLEFRPRRPKPKPAARPRTAPQRSAADELALRLATGDRFVLELLADPEQSEEMKTRAKARWSATPENAGRTPPWLAATTKTTNAATSPLHN